MYLRNHWYVAARTEEVGRGLLRRLILNEPVLLYRTKAGEAVAMEDRCCHRSVPLSIGKLVDDNVQCGYHGLVFDRDGRCVFMPGQDKIPAAAKVKAYPLIERWGMIWLWMGEGKGDPALMPDFGIVDRPGWAALGDRVHLKANYLLGIDNILDLSHLSYVHERTIGTVDVARTAVRTTREGDMVKVTRWMMDVPPPPMFAKFGLTGNIDRWQIVTAAPPCYLWLEVGGAKTGTGAAEGNRSEGIERWNLNCITPETDKSAHMFWTEVRNFQVDDAAAGEMLKSQMVLTLQEDADVLEVQQRTMDEMPDAPTIDITFDAGSIQFRRAVKRLLEEQANSAREKALA
ncbi:aromatic ring-hydroxylating dioxygenase subunit alpha [Pseudolabrys taiwanensis]|uniref:Aromatic ring-hydroxylating dioxygenase subunit alpha n=1 Tax=Pseudolabrys taiwanensis TaxID=331696 RepID=A0A346A1U2_9HYPH|nr:aromatic ring-hydroxylating dioxygenase subunit alpha [Pseudolabrys taiwanensis]AXK83139.1 aromatic ring-hydroxylating dioxygenase subunit alpha [Pseudolabrys taiwanensis]